MAKHTYGVLIMMTRRDDVVRVKVGFNADNPHASPIFTVVQRRLEVTDFPLLKNLQTHMDGRRAALPALHQLRQGG